MNSAEKDVVFGIAYELYCADQYYLSPIVSFDRFTLMPQIYEQYIAKAKRLLRKKKLNKLFD